MDINKIYLGDAYELIKQVPDKSVDLIVTDPPYEMGGGCGLVHKDGPHHAIKLIEEETK